MIQKFVVRLFCTFLLKEVPIDTSRYVEESLRGMTVEMEVMPSSDGSYITLYDPAFILEFSAYVLSIGYIESMEFARLGLLGLAFIPYYQKANLEIKRADEIQYL